MTVVDTTFYDLLPEVGYYCMQWQTAKGGKWHKLYSTKADMVDDLMKRNQTTDVWYALGTFDGACSDPKSPAKQTKRRENVVAIRCVAVDVDMKAGDPLYHATKADIDADLSDAIDNKGLPVPSYVVDSRNGYHLYWVFDTDITSGDYDVIAASMVAFLQKNAPKLIADTTSTTGAERVLRWPGQMHRKPGLAPYPITILEDNAVRYTPRGLLDSLGGPAAHRSKSTTVYQNNRGVANPLVSNSKIPSNQPLEVILGCNAMMTLAQKVSNGYDTYVASGDYNHLHKIPEPGWLGMLAILKFFGPRGKALAKWMSEYSQNYDEDVFEAKFTYAENEFNTYGCTAFCQSNNIPRTVCHGCPAWVVQGEDYVVGKVQQDAQPADLSVSIARFNVITPPTAVQYHNTNGIVDWVPLEPKDNRTTPPSTVLTYASQTRNLPNLMDPAEPLGFWYTLEGELGEHVEVPAEIQPARKPGDVKLMERRFVRLSRRLVWPIGMLAPAEEIETQGGYRVLYGAYEKQDNGYRYYEFELEPSQHTDKRALLSAMAGHGIDLLDRDTSYIRMAKFFDRVKDKLPQKVIKSPISMGWNGGEFSIGDTTLTVNGPEKARYYNMDDEIKKRFTRKGDPEKQLEAFNYIFNKAADPAKLFMLASLATPLISMLGGAGANTNPVIVLEGKPGTGKSLALSVGQSLWGEPEGNQLTEASTINSMYAMFGNHRHLPVLFDEIGNFADKEALAGMIGMFSGGKPKTAQTKENKSRKGAPPWNTVLLCTSNESLHSSLTDAQGVGFRGLAKMRRVLEVPVYGSLFGPKDPGIVSALDTLKSNHGYIGPTVMQYVVDNYQWVKSRMIAERDAMQALPEYTTLEAFYVAVLAGINVVTEILDVMGIMTIDPTWRARASAQFKSHTMENLAAVQNKEFDILSHILKHAVAHTYRFISTQFNVDVGHNNDPDKLNRREAGRVRYVEDQTGPNVVDRYYFDQDWLNRTLVKEGYQLKAVIDGWQAQGFRVASGHAVIEAGAFDKVALSAPAPAPGTWGMQPVPVVILEIDRP